MIVRMLQRTFIFCLLIVATAAVAQAEPGEPLEWFHWAIGSYQSDIHSAGELLKGTTIFEINQQGDLAGSYTFEEKDSLVEGILFPCTAQSAPHRVSCVWTDKYGTGKLDIQFEEGFKSFYGSWQTDGHPEKYEWNGRR